MQKEKLNNLLQKMLVMVLQVPVFDIPVTKI